VKEKFATWIPATCKARILVPLVLRNEKSAVDSRKEFLMSMLPMPSAFSKYPRRIRPSRREKISHRIAFFRGCGHDGRLLEWLQAEFSWDGKFGMTRHVEAPQEIFVIRRSRRR
jgi:hypothetical protein